MDQPAERIDQLNKLVTINNDRIEGYQKASHGTQNSDLKVLFGQYAEQSLRFKHELVDEITSLEGQVNDGGSASGKLHRAWMDVRHALSNNDEKGVLKNCEYGESIAIDTYNQALNNDVPYSQKCRFRLENQRSELKDALDTIKSLGYSVA